MNDRAGIPGSEIAHRSKVLVAMSGGVDSSVAAAMLTRAGHECIGVFMRLGSPGESLDELMPGDAAACAPTKIGKQGCCSINDAADARMVAAQLGIPFYVVNFKREFGRVIDYFVDEYVAGRTPNPCVRCNDWLKFGRLHEYAEQLGCGFVASGHYARVERGSGVGGGGAVGSGGPWRLMRGLDHAKDQSYVLFGVPREQLGRMMLPIGGFRKAEIREMARQMGLPVFDKADSQEICFVPDNDYAGLVERRRPEVVREGEVVDESGGVVGEHQGQHRFTIGQRRGLGLALGRPLYVVGKDVASGRVTLGPRESLRVSGCVVHESNWLVDEPGRGELVRVLARYRSNGSLVGARVRVLEDVAAGASGRCGAFEVEFDEAQEAVVPGQALVVYDAGEPEVVMGGGWIAEARRVGG